MKILQKLLDYVFAILALGFCFLLFLKVLGIDLI